MNSLGLHFTLICRVKRPLSITLKYMYLALKNKHTNNAKYNQIGIALM